MEIVWIAVVLLLTGSISYLLWKNHCLKRDVYDFAQKLDGSLNQLMNGNQLETVVYEQDDLWGMVYEKLYRVSDLYTHKNQEVSEEKESLKELVSDISHQTKTPIANIKLYLEMLLEEINPSESIPYDTPKGIVGCPMGTEYLKKLDGQVDKLDFLLQSMVKISRLETGTIKIQKSDHLVAETLALAIEAAFPKADKKKIPIYVECDEDLLLNHDKKWTAEAIFNLLDNAVKYSKTGSYIYISVTDGEIFTKVSVTDTGKGIPLERQGTIFRRFYREPEVHDSEGIGVGLYLARKIITMQSGYIQVESEVGQGSTFFIYLPN